MKTSVKIPVLTPPPLHHPNTPPLRWGPQKLRPAENVTTSVTTSTAKMYNVHAVCYDVTTCTPPLLHHPPVLLVLVLVLAVPILALI